jgi:ATP adenylyltransferase
MKMLYAPWRSEYTSDTHEGKNEDTAQEGCVFCNQFASKKDIEHGIIKRFDHTIVIINKYPYNAGHVLLLPIEHIGSIDKLAPQVRAELMELINISVTTVKDALKAEGVNVGINIGKAAGAGIPSHLHVHVLPRWNGDTNYMPTIGQTKVISFDLNTVYKTLVKAFEAVKL